MFKILKREQLNPSVVKMVIDAPLIARKAEPGQFIILRVDEVGERIPLTVADYDRSAGTVTIIFQVAGTTTALLAEKNENESIQDFAGPLGIASHLEAFKRVAVIGGGVGCAIAYPQAKKLHALGAEVDVITGFRSSDLIILEDEFRAVCDKYTCMTDDGSNGNKGFVTNALKENIEAGAKYDTVIAIGPLVMMRAVCDVTKPYGIKTIVSMNPVMIDGSGMCGGCRLTVGGKTRFACVDGPDFDGHEVDFEEAIRRSRMYFAEERQSFEEHCNLIKGAH